MNAGLPRFSEHDRHELDQLYARYCHAVDDFDTALAVSLFTQDGGFRRTNSTPFYPGARDWVGTDELTEYFGARRPGPRARQHWVNAVLFSQISADEVEARASFCIMEAAPTAVNVIALGSYRDELTRVDGSWLFRNRYVTFL